MARTIVFYHGRGTKCPDGFGGAYAAWKKFGDSAEYVALARGDEPPFELVKGNEVYFIDFSYEKDVMEKLLGLAHRMVVLDHHEGVQEATEVAPEHVFDANRSGAGIAWDYFYPGVPRPALLNHIEDDDLFRFALPDTREIITYLEVQPYEFPLWDEIAHKLDAPAQKEQILHTARAYREYFERIAAIAVERAKLVSFEGYEVLFATAHPIKSLKSKVGNLLAKEKGPIGLVVTAHPNGYGVSIRGDGSVDVSKIAQKFGGNGHPNSSGFLIPREGPFPWTLIETDEDSRD
jgi:oligoribonuclease NrnB/cAMP/cGMP phosphodiesterase (DHH superfamily)